MEESENPLTLEKLPEPPLKTQWWRWLAVSVLTLLSATAASVVLFILVSPDLKKADLTSLAVTVASVAVYLPFILLFARIFHGRALQPFVTEKPRFRWKRMFFYGAVWLLLAAASELVMFALAPRNYTWQFDAGTFPGILAIALLLVPLQAAAEEVVIRGYLLQGLQKLFRQKWVAMTVTSLVFFALHGANPEFIKYGWGFALVNYLGFGLFFGALTLLDRGLEIAIGIHVVNNVYGILLVSFSDSALGNHGLISINRYDPLASSLIFLTACALVLIIFLIRKKKEDVPAALPPAADPSGL